MQVQSNETLSLHLYPENTQNKLEFDIIKSAILDYCVSELGRKETINAKFLTDKAQIVKKLYEVKEFQDILIQDYSFPLDYYHDLFELLKFIEIPDYTILPNDALQILQFIDTTELVIKFLNKHKDIYSGLFAIIKDIEFQKNLKHKLHNIIDIDGEIKSSASDKLLTIRKNIHTIEIEIDRCFNKTLSYCKSKEWLTDELESVRNGERVLAFISKYKRKIKGIVFDESLTGKTTFIQPDSVLDLRNKWFDLKHKEKREVFIILKELTKYIRQFLPDIYHYQDVMAYVDHIRAKARYSNYIGANVPLISEQPQIKIIKGYHPVLFSRNRLIGKNIIPIDLELDQNNRILVISGPNAGGKSVCLKTVGLFQLMVQYGLPVPADENSIFGIFYKLFVDIGDDQSIENDLSTYSSRLMNQNHFINNADVNTLFLIDEFGSGTEPGTGGVIAEVILEKFNDLKCLGIATTHYTNLKILAGKTKGIKNAAMLFDTIKLQPLYKLSIGEPGSSFALEILENICFDTQLINSAKERLKKDELELNNLLIDLQNKKEISVHLINSLQLKENQLNLLLEENNNIKNEIKNKRNQFITNSREEAEQYLQRLIKEFEKLVRGWKESKEQKKDEISKFVRKQIQLSRAKIVKEKKSSFTETSDIVQEIFVEGDDVILKENGQKGTIIRIKKEKCLVLFGNIKTEIELNKLQKTEKKILKHERKSFNTTLYKLKMESFNPVLDLRGFRREAAILELEIYIDKAILHDFNQLRIIHGYGDGILKEAIRTTLKKYTFIKSVYSEHPDHGGDGVSIIEL